MEARGRRLVSRLVLAVLALAALGSLSGGGFLLSERYGLIALRRAPSVFLSPVWEGEHGRTIAIVNTDTVSGLFVLDFEKTDEVVHTRPSDSALRVWLPRRSIVLRSAPSVPEGYSYSPVAVLFRARDAERVDRSGDEGPDSPRLAPRGTRVSLECLSDRSGVQRFWIERRGVTVIERPGLVFVANRKIGGAVWAGGLAPLRDIAIFEWDGKAPLTVDIDTATPTPDGGLLEVWTDQVTSEGTIVHGNGLTRLVLAYDPDMTIIDERTPEPGK